MRRAVMKKLRDVKFSGSFEGHDEFVGRIKRVFGEKIGLLGDNPAVELEFRLEKRPLIGPKVPDGKFEFVASPVGQNVAGYDVAGQQVFIAPSSARRGQHVRITDDETGLTMIISV